MRERVSTDATAETQSMTMNSAPYYNIDKTLFSNARSIGGLFLLVKEYYGILWIEKQGLAMRLGKEGGAAAALMRNQLTFWSSHPPQRLFRAEFRQTRSARLKFSKSHDWIYSNRDRDKFL